ncbi:MAG: efflux RND transporter permease subunit [Sulfurospirillum sp.]
MFERVLKFFIENYKLNYILFFLVFGLGVYSYIFLPKEVSPVIEPDSITIRGGYSGTSLDTLNKMAVEEIEAEVQNIDGIDTISSRITPGRFSITLELRKGADKQKVQKDIDDAITAIKSDLPSDMDELTTSTVAHARGLMQVSVFSKTLGRDRLIENAKELRLKLLGIKDISDVTIFGDSDIYYEVLIDGKKAEAYGLTQKQIIDVIPNISYIFPLGKIDSSKQEYYISLENKKDVLKEFKKTFLNIDDRVISLKDVATIKKRYRDSSTLASMNGKNAITLSISQNPKGNALEISKQVKKMIKRFQKPQIEYDIRNDHSTVIKDRLDIVISNILMGIILITLMTFLLINFRMAMVIALGIPTSFVMGAIYFYLTGYSVNINSLIGVLIAIGIIVDDAIVISENIQQYIEKGFSPKEAAFLGTKEMAKPVTIASLTTIFAFIPLLMLTGRLGQIMELIPIAVSVLVVASLIESFLFLPIHSAHILNKNAHTLSWKRISAFYSKMLKIIIRHKILFLTIFLILTPFLMYNSLKHLRFKMFEPFDSTSVSITYKASKDTTLQDSIKIVQTIENDLLKHKKEFFIDYVSSTAGYRRSATGGAEMYPYVGYVTLYLQKRAPSNFLEKYITPYLSFYYAKKGRIRTENSRQISRKLRKFLRKKEYKRKFHLREINTLERRMGHSRADIMIGVIGTDYKKVIKGIKKLKNSLRKIKAVKFVGDNMKFGSNEIKLNLNSYGKQLGVTQKYLGNYIADLYLEKKKGVILDKEGMLDIKVSSKYKDRVKDFDTLKIALKNGQTVMIKDICDFSITQSLEKLTKDDGEVNFYVYANIDQDISTTGEAMMKIMPVLKELKKSGLRYKLRGEYKQKKILQNDMLNAIVVAIILIFLSILYLFNSIGETLIVMSVIPLSFLGVLFGHQIMGLNLSMPSIVGALGLAGVIVNDGILMLSIIKTAKRQADISILAAKRFRPIILTSVTTIIGLSSLIFFATGEAVTFQPLAVSLGFGLLWGTILNLFYLPNIYALYHRRA